MLRKDHGEESLNNDRKKKWKAKKRGRGDQIKFIDLRFQTV